MDNAGSSAEQNWFVDGYCVQNIIQNTAFKYPSHIMFYCQLRTFLNGLLFVLQFSFFINVVLVFLYWSYLQKTMVIDWGALFQLARARSEMRKKHSNKKNIYSLELIIACTQLRFPYIIRTLMYRKRGWFSSVVVCVGRIPWWGPTFFPVSRDWGKWAISYS